MKKMWECSCGKTAAYEGVQAAQRYLTHDRRCSKCGAGMHIKTKNLFK